MGILYVIVPLMVLGIVIAVIPVLVGSIHQDRSIREGMPANTYEAAREANRWHTTLGRRVRRTPRELTPGSDATTSR